MSRLKVVVACLFAVLGAFFMAALGIAVSRYSPLLDWRLIVAGRAISSTIICWTLLQIRYPFRDSSKPSFAYTRPVLLRALLGSTGMLCMFYAYKELNPAEASVLLNLHPVWIYLIWCTTSHKRPALPESCAILLAFAGVLTIVGQVGIIQPLGIITGLLGSLFIGGAMVALSQSAESNPLFVVFIFSFTASLVLVPVIGIWMCLSECIPMTINFQVFLYVSFLCGALATLGQLFLTLSYHRLKPYIVGVLSLLQVPFTAGIGYALSVGVLTWNTLAGSLLLLLGSAILVVRTRRTCYS